MPVSSAGVLQGCQSRGNTGAAGISCFEVAWKESFHRFAIRAASLEAMGNEFLKYTWSCFCSCIKQERNPRDQHLEEEEKKKRS